MCKKRGRKREREREGERGREGGRERERVGMLVCTNESVLYKLERVCMCTV